MTRLDREVGHRLLKLHQFVYEATGGVVGHRLGHATTLLLRTRGRRSGELRTAALLYVRDGEDYVVVGSKGGSDQPPAWLLNLQADSEVEVQIGTARFAATAKVASAATRKRLWPVVVRVWPQYDRYQSQTEREIPLVILSRGA
jgi:deazaflavin-dependent oxidoreductase (nitroreductase family)